MSIVGMRKFMQGRLQYIMLGLAVIFAVGIVGIGIGSGRFGGGEEERGASGTLAKINGKALDRRAFEVAFYKRLEQIEEQQGRRLGPYEESMIRGSMFDEYVDQILREQAAKEAGIRVSRRDVKRKVNEIVDQQVEQWKEALLADKKGKKTDKDFEAALKKQDLTISKLKAKLRENLDPEEVRRFLLNEKLEAQWKSAVDVSDKALRESYDEVMISRITIGFDKRSEAQAKKKAEEIASKLRGGADFATLAKENSEDPWAARGGDMGYALRRQYTEKELASVVFGLKKGEIAGPIKTPMGYTIVKLNDKKSALPADFNDPKKKKEYREEFVKRVHDRVLMEKPQELREKAKIEVLDPELKAYVAMKDLYMAKDDKERKAKALEIIDLYRKAAESAGDGTPAFVRSHTQIGIMYNRLRTQQFGAVTDEERAKYTLEAEKALRLAWQNAGSNDLDIMLAELYMEQGKKLEALEHVETVALNAGDDPQYHDWVMSQLEKMRELNSPKVKELLVQEQDWKKQYEQQMQEQANTTPQPVEVTPQPGGR